MSKPDFLQDTPPHIKDFTSSEALRLIAERVGWALLAGLIVAALYHYTLGRRKRDGAAMPLTLVLLSVLVCMVTLVVNGNLALAFTLGGTLAIVRFRTVVDDTRDTAFVIAAVVVGMSMGIGALGPVLIGLPVIAALLFVAFAILPHTTAPAHKLIVRINNDKDPEELTRAAFAMLPVPPALLGLEIARQGTAVEAIYGTKMLDATMILKLLNALRSVEGVQGVEVKPM